MSAESTQNNPPNKGPTEMSTEGQSESVRSVRGVWYIEGDNQGGKKSLPEKLPAPTPTEALKETAHENQKPVLP